MQLILLVNGLVILFSAGLMGVMALVFPATAEVFGLAAFLAAVLGGSLALAGRTGGTHFTRRHTFMLTTTAWITASTAGALPLHLWGLSMTDAFFEAMSGITTTGSTVMSGLDGTARGILMWRALLQWVGGVGIIVTGIAILPILKVGGMQLFQTESSDRGEKELGSAARFAAATVWTYVALSVACMLAYLAGGMTPFDAVTHMMTTLSTGGYSTHDASMGYFESPWIHWSASLFMLCGSLPFAWYIRAINKRVLNSEQLRVYLVTLAGVIAVLTLWRMATSETPLEEALRQVTFNVISVVTTTGYATTDYTLWGPFAITAFFLLTALGGCTGSTAGGLKVMRWIVTAKIIRDATWRIIHPHRIVTLRYEGRALERDVSDGVIGFVTVYLLTVTLLALVLAMTGLDPDTSISGALTAVANVGPGVGPLIGPAGNFSGLPDLAKWLLSFGMLLGRLEIMTVLLLLSPRLWKA